MALDEVPGLYAERARGKRIGFAGAGPRRDLLVRVAQLKLQYFGQVVRGNVGELALMAMNGAMKGTRSRSAPKKHVAEQHFSFWNGGVNPIL